MRDRLQSFPELRVFCQNVNRNYGYMDSLLAELYDHYDLLFIQEPPWRLIRSAPSSSSREGTDVIGGPLSPNWGCLVRPSGLESPPRVMGYFNQRIANLRPGLRRDVVDHRDILLFSLGIGGGLCFSLMSTQAASTLPSCGFFFFCGCMTMRWTYLNFTACAGGPGWPCDVGPCFSAAYLG
jgi:hypothetical protein